MPDRFLLFSLPRCGSTTLMRVLACHPGINCLREPFNPDQSGRRYLDRVHDPASLAATLRDIWATHQGIKHVWHASGWPFADPSFNARMLDLPDITVLFLNRRNELRRLISYEIAMQTHIWHRPDPEPDRSLAALDPAALQAGLTAARQAVSALLNQLVTNRTRFHQLWYEDFFDPEVAPADRVARVDRLLWLLDYTPLTARQPRDRAIGLLDPAANRLNDEHTYRLIPNIDEIDTICGNARFGRVFASEP